jgi:hypothetical protein
VTLLIAQGFSVTHEKDTIWAFYFYAIHGHFFAKEESHILLHLSHNVLPLGSEMLYRFQTSENVKQVTKSSFLKY